MSEWVGFVILKFLEWLIPFGLGLLFRKKVGRFIIRTKKWLFNDVVTANILSIRTYTPVEVHDFNYEVYENVKAKIPNPKLHDVFIDGMRIVVPTFGILRLHLSRITDQENMEEHEETVEKIKVTLQPENPVRLGIREVHLLNDFVQIAGTLFDATEKLFATGTKLIQNYTILEFPRFGRFVEEKTFEKDDEDLGAHVHATPTKITIVVSPTSQMAKAASKYLLV